MSIVEGEQPLDHQHQDNDRPQSGSTSAATIPNSSNSSNNTHNHDSHKNNAVNGTGATQDLEYTIRDFFFVLQR